MLQGMHHSAFYLGQTTLAQLEAAAAGDGEKCEVDFYVGEWHLLKGDAASARARFKQALSRCPANFIERKMAEIESKRIAG
jgi:lipoprotein NlpI